MALQPAVELNSHWSRVAGVIPPLVYRLLVGDKRDGPPDSELGIGSGRIATSLRSSEGCIGCTHCVHSELLNCLYCVRQEGS